MLRRGSAEWCAVLALSAGCAFGVAAQLHAVDGGAGLAVHLPLRPERGSKEADA